MELVDATSQVLTLGRLFHGAAAGPGTTGQLMPLLDYAA